jgi:hypothetical protein
MILDPENQLTRETLQVCVSKNANFSSAAANLQNYIGRVQVIVSAGLLTTGDNDGTLNVRIDDSPDNSTYTSTGTYTTAFANTAATQVVSVDTRAVSKWIRCHCVVGGTNTPTRPVAIELIGTKQNE